MLTAATSMERTAAPRGCLRNRLVSRENRQYDTVTRSHHQAVSEGSLKRQVCPGHVMFGADSSTDGVGILAIDHRAKPHLRRSFGGLGVEFAYAPASLQPRHPHRHTARIVSCRQQPYRLRLERSLSHSAPLIQQGASHDSCRNSDYQKSGHQAGGPAPSRST